MSFNFKKRCLEIFANVYEHSNENQNDDEFAFDSFLDQTLHEDENSLNLNDLLIQEVYLGNSALSILDVSDNTKCRYCFNEFGSKEEAQSHMEVHKGDDKPYKCPQEGCNSSFKARKNLKDHYLGKMFIPASVQCTTSLPSSSQQRASFPVSLLRANIQVQLQPKQARATNPLERAQRHEESEQ